MLTAWRWTCVHWREVLSARAFHLRDRADFIVKPQKSQHQSEPFVNFIRAVSTWASVGFIRVVLTWAFHQLCLRSCGCNSTLPIYTAGHTSIYSSLMGGAWITQSAARARKPTYLGGRTFYYGKRKYTTTTQRPATPYHQPSIAFPI